MTIFIITIFIAAYILIAFEEKVKLDKAIPALLSAAIIWAAYAISSHDVSVALADLSHHIGEVAGIVFFVWGALTIVELTDAHNGFEIITSMIKTRNPQKLIWITSIITFFLAAIIDNLTASLLMTAILFSIIKNREERAFFACIAVIAANAGGTWSPLGEITTTMLWAKGQISIGAITSEMFIPSLVSLIVPLGILSTFVLKKQLKQPTQEDLKELENQIAEKKNDKTVPPTEFERNTMLTVSVLSLLLIPIFKTVTHLPPYMGMIFSLGIVWVTSELLHHKKDSDERKKYTVAYALSKVNATNLFFFLGILLAVSGLEATHILKSWGDSLLASISNIYLVDFIIGIFSAVIDNVPLVAAMQGMYDLSEYPTDSPLWIFLAYTAGTGGSILVIGSAAGVGVMGMMKEQITFGWFFKKISLWAFIAYCTGAVCYLFLKTYIY